MNKSPGKAWLSQGGGGQRREAGGAEKATSAAFVIGKEQGSEFALRSKEGMTVMGPAVGAVLSRRKQCLPA